MVLKRNGCVDIADISNLAIYTVDLQSMAINCPY